MSNDIHLTMAMSGMRGSIPAGKPLEARLRFAMSYVRKHERDLFWMQGRTDDNDKFRVALGAVMLESDEADCSLITRSVMPLRMLSAASSGIPVDFAALGDLDDLLPLMKWWHESGEESR